MKVSYNMHILKRYIDWSQVHYFENRQLPFYLQICNHFIAGSSYFTEREGFDSYLLMYTVNGSGIIKFRDKKFNVEKGQVLILDCREYQYYATKNSQDMWEFKWIHFNGTAAGSYCRLINQDSISVIQLTQETQFEEIFESLFNLLTTDDINKDVKCSLLITNMLTEMIVNSRSNTNSLYPKHNLIIENAKTFIHENYAKNISIEDVLAHIHLSRFHFTRTFKRYTGMSPYEYLNNCRVNASKILLLETNMSINEIALKVGFSHANTYIREFKVINGITPKRYKDFMM